MEDKLIEQKEKLLEKFIFRWARNLKLVVHPTQVTVKITIRAQSFTEDLEEKDWKKLLDTKWEWEKHEIDFLNYLKNNGNTCDLGLALDRYFANPSGGYFYYLRRMENRIRLYGNPYILSRLQTGVRSEKVLRIRKRFG